MLKHYVAAVRQVCAPCSLILLNLKITSEILHSKMSVWTRYPTVPSTGIIEGAFFLPVIINYDYVRHSICLYLVKSGEFAGGTQIQVYV